MERPYGEMFFPNPSVGYSQVTIKSIHNNSLKRSGTGSVVEKYYTAKDFPVIVHAEKKKIFVTNQVICIESLVGISMIIGRYLKVSVLR